MNIFYCSSETKANMGAKVEKEDVNADKRVEAEIK